MSSPAHNNNFDAIRVFAAILVLIWHAFVLSGNRDYEWLFHFSHQSMYLGALGVDVFFCTSGYLIYASWQRDPNPIRFIANRVLRIFPGLLVALLVAVLVIGPIMTTFSLRDYFSNHETWVYLASIKLFPLHWNLPGCFAGNPFKDAVNGSLWTIPHEVVCYLMVVFFGFLGILFEKFSATIIWLFFLSFYFLNTQGDFNAFLPLPHFIPLDRSELLAFMTTFSGGMALRELRDKIPLHGALAFFAFLAFLGMCGLGWGNIAGVVLVPYIVVYLAYSPTIRLHNFGKFGDLSYGMYIYGFPLEQICASPGSPVKNDAYGVFLCSLVSSAILAFLSWHLIEKRSLALKDSAVLRSALVEKASLLVEQFKRLWAFTKQTTGPIGMVLISLALVAMVCKWSKSSWQLPAVITFPGPARQLNALKEGWLPSDNEPYRWVMSRSRVMLNRPPGTVLHLSGYVPEKFPDQQLTIFIDGKIAQVVARPKAKEAWALDVRTSADSRERCEILLVFDAQFHPPPSDADQRSMSALITELGWVPAVK